jgi:hypothetical protein
MKYLVVFFLLLLGYTFIYAGLSHYGLNTFVQGGLGGA